MKKYKVIYHIGDSIGLETKAGEGFLFSDGDTVFIIPKGQKEKIALDDIRSVSPFRLNGLGSMLKVRYGTTTIFLSAVWFCIGGQFALINFFDTRGLKSELEKCMKL